MEVMWNALIGAPTFQQGMQQGRERAEQRQRENALMQQQQEELDFRRQGAEREQQNAQREQLRAAAQLLNPVYQQLRQMPYEQRRAALQSLAPRLQAQGIPTQIIDGYDPTDQNLDSDIMLSRRMTGEGYTLTPGAIRFGPDNQVVARGGPTPDRYIPVPADGRLMRVGPNGQVEESLPTVNSPDEARRLQPGTRFRDPQGNVRTVPGGPQLNPAGGF